MRTWLLGIARALVANDGRRRDRQRVGEERLRGSALLDEDDAARLDERIDAAARSRQLYRAMDRLPRRERTILELVAIDELVELQAARDFDYAVDGATASYGPVGADRADLVRERIHQLIARC